MDDVNARRPGNLSDVIRNKLGSTARCPKCGNESEFTAYMTTDIVSVNVVADTRIGRPWMITEPNLGMLRLRDIRCSRCGHRNTPQHFMTRGQVKAHEEV